MIENGGNDRSHECKEVQFISHKFMDLLTSSILNNKNNGNNNKS